MGTRDSYLPRDMSGNSHLRDLGAFWSFFHQMIPTNYFSISLINVFTETFVTPFVLCREVLYQIEQCELENYEIDPILLATVFYDKARGFNSHYTQYCTNYPEASQFFSIIMQDPGIHDFFLVCFYALYYTYK